MADAYGFAGWLVGVVVAVSDDGNGSLEGAVVPEYALVMCCAYIGTSITSVSSTPLTLPPSHSVSISVSPVLLVVTILSFIVSLLLWSFLFVAAVASISHG